MIVTISLITFSYTSLNAANNGEELFMQKCAVCHTVGKADKSTIIAPPTKGIVFHLKEEFITNKIFVIILKILY